MRPQKNAHVHRSLAWYTQPQGPKKQPQKKTKQNPAPKQARKTPPLPSRANNTKLQNRKTAKPQNRWLKLAGLVHKGADEPRGHRGAALHVPAARGDGHLEVAAARVRGSGVSKPGQDPAPAPRGVRKAETKKRGKSSTRGKWEGVKFGKEKPVRRKNWSPLKAS